MPDIYHTAILGAGAAGLMAAMLMPDKNKIIIEGNTKPGAKILASGGGLCNFSNINLSKQNYYGANTMFCLSALAGFKPKDFAALMDKNKAPYNIRPDGKMFALSSKSVLDMLLNNIKASTTRFALDSRIKAVVKNADYFEITTDNQVFQAKNVLCALGGLSYPKLGASPAGYKIAESFGLSVANTYPALTGINFNTDLQNRFKELAGVSLKAAVSCGKIRFEGDILFTHTGLSGPAIFQLSLYGLENNTIKIDFMPGTQAEDFLIQAKQLRQKASNLLAQYMPGRLAKCLIPVDKQMTDMSKADIRAAAEALNRFTFTPATITGYDKAEITAGGVDTKDISSKTMQANNVPGLFFAGEVLDISGQLGGYNLHWAWASAAAAARALNTLP